MEEEEGLTFSRDFSSSGKRDLNPRLQPSMQVVVVFIYVRVCVYLRARVRSFFTPFPLSHMRSLVAHLDPPFSFLRN